MQFKENTLTTYLQKENLTIVYCVTDTHYDIMGKRSDFRTCVLTGLYYALVIFISAIFRENESLEIHICLFQYPGIKYFAPPASLLRDAFLLLDMCINYSLAKGK